MHQLKKILPISLLITLFAGAAYGWGAISVDDGEGFAPSEVGYGIVTSIRTKSAAELEALKACRAEGNQNCLLALTFEKCGAYAASQLAYGAAAATTLKAAEENALSDCGDKECKIVISDCGE